MPAKSPKSTSTCVVSASWWASRTAPAQALGEASVDTRPMTRGRRLSDLALLAGATRWQVLRLVGAEALTVVAVRGVLGLLVAGLNLLGMWSAPRLLSAPTTIEIPWTAVGAVLGACAVTAVVWSVIPAAFALRRRAVELAGVRE